MNADNITITFNASENPFAYIRTEYDVDWFIHVLYTILQQDNTKERLTREACQILWITIYYLATYVLPIERNFESVIKLLNAIKEGCDRPESCTTPFQILINDTGNETLKKRYAHFISSVFGEHSVCCKKTIDLCKKVLLHISDEKIKQKFIVPKTQKITYQAIIQDDSKEYEIWFMPGNSFRFIMSIYGIVAMEIPSFFFNERDMEIIKFAFSQSDYSFKTIIETHKQEILNKIKKDEGLYSEKNTITPLFPLMKEYQPNPDIIETMELKAQLFDDLSRAPWRRVSKINQTVYFNDTEQ